MLLIACDHSYFTMEVKEEPEENAPYRSSKLPGTVNWGTATVVGVFAGMLYGGMKEASASVVSMPYQT
nr:mitochondrial inner membrane translocase subunit TIM17/TIM22/TIM23/peroxisomal protein PMP24 [Tanacetum cinerariifolium]